MVRVKKYALAAITIPVLILVSWLPNSAKVAGGGSFDSAEATFKAKCAMCHGLDGSGNTANGKKLNVRSFKSPDFQKMTDAQLLEIISRGKNKMPGYEKTLGKDAVTQLVAYTRALSKK